MNNLIKKHKQACTNDGTITPEMDHQLFLDKMQDRLLDCYEEIHSVFGMQKEKYAQKLIELAATALMQVEQLGIDPEIKFKSVTLLHEEGSDQAILFSNAVWINYSSGFFKEKKVHLRIQYATILGKKIFKHIETQNSKRKVEYYPNGKGNIMTEEEVLIYIKNLKG